MRSAAHIKVEMYAAAFGVKVIEGKLDGARARLKVGPRPIIRVSDRPCHPGERSFSIAHELGHFVLRHPASRIGALCKREPFRPVGPGTARHPEAEANTVSAGVCMPSELLAKTIETATPSLDVTHAIATEYAMPLQATTIRFAELTSKRCAAIYSEVGKVVWAVSSKTFPANVPRGKRLDPASLAYGYVHNGKVDDRARSIAADAWIATDAGVELVEHSAVVPETKGVITLLWIPEATAPPGGVDRRGITLRS
ncbi:MAG: ImmA/IrrE family metallo-endopeptidase [Proteobacteria bacterium]|nr:ImmA/IrrE family metallo-endopeptidase [Pseudomonadota bacterium]